MIFLQKFAGLTLMPAFTFLFYNAKAQSNQMKLSFGATSSLENKFNNKKAKWILPGSIIAYGGITAGLYSSWYKDYEFKNFHFVNDNKNWLQVDKAGHAWSGYMLGRINIALLRYTGIKEKKAVWTGGLVGFAYMNVIEILDGFSSGWGFSWGDYIADIAGTGLVMSQELCWSEQRILYKFSSHLNHYTDDILNERANKIYGENWPGRLLNDYNAQTYWLSMNLKSFFKKSNLPSWLNLAVGYGAGGMFGELNNKWTDANGIEFDRSDQKRIRQFYLSPDIDLSKIKTKSKFLRTGFFILQYSGKNLSSKPAEVQALVINAFYFSVT